MNKKIRLLSFVLLFFSSKILAQGWSWANQPFSYPNFANAGYSTIAVDSADNVFTAFTLGSNNFSTGLIEGNVMHFGALSVVDSTNTAQTILTKTDRNGNYIWAIATQHANSGVADITTDKEGNIYILGVYDSTYFKFGDSTLSHPVMPPNPSNVVFYFSKINAVGVIQWIRNIIPTSAEGAGAGAANAMVFYPEGKIQVDDTGNVYVAGSFSDPSVTIGADVLTLGGLTNIFIAKYDGNAFPIWAKSYGGTTVDYVKGMAVTKHGDIVIAGNGRGELSFHFPPLTVTTTNNMGNFLVDLDNSGNAIWAKHTDSIAYFTSIAQDSLANTYLCGNFMASKVAFDTFHITNRYPGNSEIFLVKVKSSGAIDWAKPIGGDSSDYAYSVSADACGNVFLVGGVQSRYYMPLYGESPYHFYINGHILDIPIPLPLNSPQFVAELDNHGNYIHNMYISSGAYPLDYFLGLGGRSVIKAGNKGEFFLSSVTSADISDTLGTNIVFFDSTHGLSFTAAFKYDSVGCIPYSEFVGVDNVNCRNTQVDIFPNPSFSESVYIKCSPTIPGSAQIRVFDMMGRLCIESTLSKADLSFPVGNLASGVYYCVVDIGEMGLVKKKLVIIH